MSDDVREAEPFEGPNGALLRAALFATIALLIGADVVSDYGEGAGWGHVAFEATVLCLACVGAALGWRRYTRMRAALVRLDADLTRTKARADRWRRENETLVQGLAEAIERQFSDWGLTRAEAEAGLLLLKGLSLQEIAELRQTSERTAREQARAVYRKGGLSGRAALSAFFLEDLLAAPEAAAGG